VSGVFAHLGWAEDFPPVDHFSLLAQGSFSVRKISIPGETLLWPEIIVSVLISERIVAQGVTVLVVLKRFASAHPTQHGTLSMQRRHLSTGLIA